MKKNEAGDNMFLEEIVEGNLIEDSEVECKSKLDRSNVVGWLKTFTGFANANGGILYVGVEDKTNKLSFLTFHMQMVSAERKDPRHIN